MILMDQPFAALVKELFDVQRYPELPHPPSLGAATGATGRGAGGRGAAGEAPAEAAPAGGGRGGGGRGTAGAAPSGTPPAQMLLRRYRLDLAVADGRRSDSGGRAGRPATRATLRKLERVDPIQGRIEGSGPVFAFSTIQMRRYRPSTICWRPA